MSDSERFHDLMFEVSNEDRGSILRELRKEHSTYSDLSRKLDITTQEVSRHLSRLTENGLTTRRTDGLLELTSYGELVLRQLNAVEFTSKHREYFVSHVLNDLPDKFVSRRGRSGNARSTWTSWCQYTGSRRYCRRPRSTSGTLTFPTSRAPSRT